MNEDLKKFKDLAENSTMPPEQRELMLKIFRSFTAIASASHNFYVTVKPWMHHKDDWLIATEKDLRFTLGQFFTDDIQYKDVHD